MALFIFASFVAISTGRYSCFCF